VKPFRAREGHYVARLDEVEREVVAQVAADVAELLGASPAQLAVATGEADDGDPWELALDPLAGLASRGSGPPEPEDPAVRRLLPTASEDAEVAEEFRRLVEPDLRELKIARLLALVRALHRCERLAVPVERADLLSGALVDVRLVLAERLGLDTDEAADELYRDLALVSYDDDGEPVVAGQRGPVAALRLHLGTVYAALTWLQESLVTAQLADLEAPDA